MEDITALEHRRWLKSFALMVVLIVLAIAFAAVLANLGADAIPS